MMEHVENNAHRRRVRTDHDGCWPEVENAVHQMFQGRRDRALPVSREDIVADANDQFQNWWTALPQAERAELTARRPERSLFSASVGWTTNFMKRKQIVFRRKTKDTSTLPPDATQRVREFQANVRQTVMDYHVHTLLNFNETFAQLDFPPMYTAETRGTVNVNVRTTLVGCTIGLGVGSNGEKLPACCFS